MKRFARNLGLTAIAITTTLLLSACIGEDYDVGVPVAELYSAGVSFYTELTEANVNWSSSDGDVNKGVSDLQLLAKDLQPTHFKINQQAYLDFTENKKNGGDLSGDPVITVYLLTEDKERIDLERHESGEFTFPDTEGNYTFVAELGSSHGFAQYVGNVKLQQD